MFPQWMQLLAGWPSHDPLGTPKMTVFPAWTVNHLLFHVRPPEEVFCKYRVPLVQYFGKGIRPWGENKLLYSVMMHLTAWRRRAVCVIREHICLCFWKKVSLLGSKIFWVSQRSWSVLCQRSDNVFLDCEEWADAWHSLSLCSVPALGFFPLLMSGWLSLGALRSVRSCPRAAEHVFLDCLGYRDLRRAIQR